MHKSFEDCLQPVMTFAEIGEEMGITSERARQIYRSAIRKMHRSHYAAGLSLLADADSRRTFAQPARRQSERGGQ